MASSSQGKFKKSKHHLKKISCAHFDTGEYEKFNMLWTFLNEISKPLGSSLVPEGAQVGLKDLS